MTVRIATLADADIVAKAVALVGQRWSQERVNELLVAPWIIAIDVNGGVATSLMLANYRDQTYADITMLLGPDAAGPSALTWVHSLRDLSSAVTAEIARRQPSWNFTNCWIHAQIFTTGCQVSGQRTVIETTMGWKKRANAISEGYDILADGSHDYHYKRATVLAKMATL